MASLPSGQDAALAALSTTLFPSSPDPDADTEESLATKRRDSAPLSIRSDYTSATGGGNSVYADATGSAYGSQATIQREDSFADANSEAASHGDLASVAVGSGDEGGVEVLAAEEEEKQHDMTPKPSTFLPSTTTPRPDSQTPPQSTFLPALVANPIDTPLATSNSTSTKAASFENEKSVPLAAGGGAGGSTPDETVLEDPELAHLNEQQRKIVAEQVHVVKRPPAKFRELFRFSTNFEVFLNCIGILGAIVSGVAQPMMTVVFGSLTTAFTVYETARLNVDETPEGPSLLEAAKSNLFRIVNQDALYLVYIGIAMFAATFVYMATWIYTGEATTRRIRERYLQAVLRQNVAYFDKMGAGEVTTRIQTDTHLIQEGISDKIPITVSFLSIFVTGFIVAIVRNWRLALVVSTIIPCIAGAGYGMNLFMSEYRRDMLEKTAEGGTLAEEVISSVRNTHAFGTQKKLTAMYDVNNEKTLELGIKSAWVNGGGMAAFFFIIYSAYALAFYYGTTLIINRQATPGQIVNVFFAILIGAFSLAQIAPNLQSLSFALGAATSIFATIDRVPVIDSASPDGLKPESVEGQIEVSNVDFIYPSRPSVQVLYDFSAVFPRGKMTALVGASGSGKSTVVGLIERFYDPIGGSIKLDGSELRDLNVKWLRTQIGLVSQEPTLFATTVAGNIAHGLIGTKFENESDGQKRARIVAAATQANADGFISNLPEGYDTMIGERGMLLSGGQKQRIAIARAIVGDPHILLLDEATSALDTASEAIVQDALEKASVGRTTITIAHRLSTIKDADQIIVMSAGRILESAMSTETTSAHTELVKRPDGAYTRLVSAQRFREHTDADDENDDASITDEKAPGGLTREQADELARNEKPIFETLKRTRTGRSAASQALSEKNRQDLESGAGALKPHSFYYLVVRMLKLNRDRKWLYVWGLLASIFSGCVYPVFGIVFGNVISVFSEQVEGVLRRGGDRYALYCFIIALLASVAVAIQNFAFGASAEHLSRILRVETFSSILRQDIAFFDKDENSTGHLTSSVSDWAQKVQGLLGITSGVIIQSIFTLIVGSIIGLSYGWKLALVGIACFPFTIAAGVVRLKVVVLKDVKNKKAHEQSAQMACEAAGAIRTVASLTREDDCSKIYATYLDEPQRQSNHTAIVANAWYSLSQALTFFVIALIFWYGARLLVDGELTTKTFFITMISIVFGSIQAGNVFNFVPDMSKARGAAADVVHLIDSRPEIDAQSPNGEKFEHCEGHIKFTDVHFRYPTRPHVRVLRGLNLEVKPGQFVAIVGPSGCGKSTLIQLVERFYDPLTGKVSVDGKDISELNIQSYRQSVSLVSQEPTLYAGSVRFNILLGALHSDTITQADVEQACKDANIHDFVLSLPDGYDTEVGGKGAQLSGGQKQRIAIARALIRNPKILLLDEATSALDSESEKVVQKALDQAAKGRSTIAVAHRLSTIQGADIIYVLRDGKVAEQGKHFELLARKGIYHELVSQQDLERK